MPRPTVLGPPPSVKTADSSDRSPGSRGWGNEGSSPRVTDIPNAGLAARQAGRAGPGVGLSAARFETAASACTARSQPHRSKLRTLGSSARRALSWTRCALERSHPQRPLKPSEAFPRKASCVTTLTPTHSVPAARRALESRSVRFQEFGDAQKVGSIDGRPDPCFGETTAARNVRRRRLSQTVSEVPSCSDDRSF